MINSELAKEFNEAADILEYNKVEWKPRAYRKAARRISDYSEDIEQLYRREGKKGLEKIEGIGERIADHIAEYIETGKIKKFEELKKNAPKNIPKLMAIEGLGPSKIRVLSKKLGVESLEDLKKAIGEQKIRGLRGFGEKTEKNIAESVAQYERSHERMLINRAMDAAEEIIAYLEKNAGPEKIDYAGSLRRMKETIGDIDLLAQAEKPEKLIDAFASMPNVGRVILKGSTKSTVILKDGISVDLRVVPRESYGSALQYFTGSKDHGIALRDYAIRKGYKLSEWGLFKRLKGGAQGEMAAGEKEEDVYSTLGLEYMPPEMRENRGEIELALKKQIPKLVELKDIRGDLQVHTKYSDGSSTIEDMAKKADSLGYEYFAVTDHSPSERIARGMTEKEIKKQWDEIEKVQKKVKVKILKGAEVDILPDGKLDYPNEVLKELDVVLASVHSRFKSDEKEMTQRIIKALEEPYPIILSHPTGRIIGKREGYKVNLDKIFQKAEDEKKIMEINADPERLDLNDSAIIEAKKYKLKFCIDTDSHSPEMMDFMRYGVGMARRGWLEKKDVVNTLSLKELSSLLKFE